MWWYSIITILLFGGVLLSYYQKYKQFDVYFLILSVYLAVSICCVIYACESPNEYLYIVVLVCISPFKGKTISKTKIPNNDSLLILLLFYIYLIAGVVSVVYTLPRALLLSQTGDWASVRSDVYNDFDGIELYTNQFERLCKNLYSYIAPFGIVWTFSQLTKKRFNKFLVFISLIVWSLEAYSSATLIASRGMILTFAVKLLTLFIYFREAIPKKRQKYIYAFGISAALFFLSYTLSVTESRFGEDSNDSLFFYFGHSMLSFNNDVFGNMTGTANGRYLFKWIYDSIGLDSTINFAQLGSTHGSSFVTFVGCFFFDFGIIGTVIFSIILSKLISATTKNLASYADLLVFFYFASWFIDGVFVLGRSQSLSWIMLFVLRFIVKKIEAKNISV